MPLVNIEKFHEQVMEAKRNGEPIIKSLKRFGVARSTYYKMIDDNGEARWRDQSAGKMVIKVKTKMIKVKKGAQEFMGMSGGGVTNEKEDSSFDKVNILMDDFEKDLEKYSKYIK